MAVVDEDEPFAADEVESEEGEYIRAHEMGPVPGLLCFRNAGEVSISQMMSSRRTESDENNLRSMRVHGCYVLAKS